jgi:hypothetical protein
MCAWRQEKILRANDPLTEEAGATKRGLLRVRGDTADRTLGAALPSGQEHTAYELAADGIGGCSAAVLRTTQIHYSPI